MERREWKFIKTKYSGKIDCGDFDLRPHWNGGRDPEYLRQTVREAVSEHNQHAALIEQRDKLAAALREARDSYLECNCYTDELGQCLGTCTKAVADAALATVEQGERT